MSKVHYASVVYHGGTQDYCFKTDLDLIQGEDVVVFSRNGLSLAKVFDPDVHDPAQIAIATAWIYCVVDIEACRRRIRAAEAEANSQFNDGQHANFDASIPRNER